MTGSESSCLASPRSDAEAADDPVSDAQSVSELFGLDASDFSCVICTELLFQPVVNRCGHAFCFGCFHHSMNSLGTSKCPLCRTLFQHFPGICWALDKVIAAAFPQQHRERASALRPDPSYKCGLSRATVSSQPNCSPAKWVRALLACVSCAKVVQHAVSINCGHLLCAACAARERNDDSPAIGETVLLQGLQSKPELNGTFVTVTGLGARISVSSKGAVHSPPLTISVKPEVACRSSHEAIALCPECGQPNVAPPLGHVRVLEQLLQACPAIATSAQDLADVAPDPGGQLHVTAERSEAEVAEMLRQASWQAGGLSSRTDAAAAPAAARRTTGFIHYGIGCDGCVRR